MLTPTRFASSSVLLACALALGATLAPGLAAAQGGGTIVIEGTLTFGAPAPPAPPPAVALPTAPAPDAPPVVIVAPAPQSIMATPAAAPTLTLAPAPISRAPSSVPTLAVVRQGEVSLEAPRTRRRWGLVGAGAGIAIGAYALNVVGSLLWMAIPTGITSTDFIAPTWNGHREELLLWSLVPVVGPLAQIAYAEADWHAPLFVAASVLEIAGFVMAIVGTASRERVAPRSDRAGAPGATVTVVPYASGTGGGLSLAGSF